LLMCVCVCSVCIYVFVLLVIFAYSYCCHFGEIKINILVKGQQPSFIFML